MLTLSPRGLLLVPELCPNNVSAVLKVWHIKISLRSIIETGLVKTSYVSFIFLKCT